MHAGAPTGTARSIARNAVGVMAVVLVLCACTATPPSPLPSSSEVPAASATPTPRLISPPERPAAMDVPGADGAAAAATHFLDLYEYSYGSLDSTAFAAMSSPECVFCRSVIDDVAEMELNNHTTTGGDYTVINSFGTEISPQQWYSAAVQLDQTPSAEIDSIGRVLSETDGGRFQMVLALDWDQSWLVREVDVTPLPSATP